jgi:hypothetical protein
MPPIPTRRLRKCLCDHQLNMHLFNKQLLNKYPFNRHHLNQHLFNRHLLNRHISNRQSYRLLYLHSRRHNILRSQRCS